MDFRRCLEVQRPYLGPLEGHFTEWDPLSEPIQALFPQDGDRAGCVAVPQCLRQLSQTTRSDGPTSSPPIVIIGAGLAGLVCAYELVRRGIEVAA